MASLAQDRFPGQAGQSKKAKAPLSTHPAFPFIVGLWFAALLGVGSLVVPVPVIARLVEMSGLAAIVPQAAPPLGFTARALIALTCTVGGGLVGLVVARKLGRAHRNQGTRKDRGRIATRRPISAHDELGAEGLDGGARGRRLLAMAEDASPSEVFELAPVPGRSLPLSALDLDEVEALELADSEMIEEEPAGEPGDPGDLAEDLPVPGFATLGDEGGEDDFSVAERRHFKLGTFGQTVGAPIQPRQQFILDPARVAEVALDEPEREPDLHFSPPLLAQFHAEQVERPDFGPDDTEEAEMDRFAEPASLAPVTGVHPAARAAADWQDSEPEDLALVQLAQRLGSSLARRREQRAAAAAAAQAAPAPAVLAEDFDAAEAAEAARAMAAYFGSAPDTAAATPPAARQVFRPVELAPAPQPAPLASLARIDLGEDEEDEDEHISSLTASFSLPLARPAPAAMTHFETIDQADAEDAEEGEVTLAPVANQSPSPAPAPFAPPAANPFQERAEQFVRIENEPEPEDGMIEPAVVFPGETRADTAAATPRATAEENERALREALLGLQRMSGAA